MEYFLCWQDLLQIEGGKKSSLEDCVCHVNSVLDFSMQSTLGCIQDTDAVVRKRQGLF